MKDDLISGMIVVIIIGFLIWLVFFVAFIQPKRVCREKFASFENKWSFYEECQIKVDNKWIPADSYYFKEE